MIVLFLLLNIIVTTFAFIDIGDTSQLYEEKDAPGFLEIKAGGSLKLVIKVYYKNLIHRKNYMFFAWDRINQELIVVQLILEDIILM